MNSGTINRAALGSSASLGDLYDARRDDFCGISIFRKGIPESALNIHDSRFSDIHLVHTDDYSEKFSKINVSAELSVSVLAGLRTLSGSGRYLSDQKSSARAVKSSLIYSVKTKEESVNVHHEDLRDAFDNDAIESGMATHFVAGISWGANSIVSCLYENTENRDAKKIGESLSTQMKMLSLAISGCASLYLSEGEKAAGVKFDVRMYGDILSKNEELPTTFEEALQHMKKFPIMVATSNEGRGKPLSYRLVPISLLKSYLNFSIIADTTFKTVEEASLARVVQLFDQMSEAQQKMNDFYQDIIPFSYCVKPKDLAKISELKDQMAIQETSFRSELATVLTNIRSGKMDISQLEDLMKRFQSSEKSPVKVISTLVDWRDLTEWINFARTLGQLGAKFIGFGESLDEELLKNFEAKSFVFYFSQNSKLEDPETWNGNRQLFFQEMKQNNNHKYYAVDCDIHPQLLKAKQFGSSFVQVIQAGQILVEDLLASTSFAQASSGSNRIVHKPTNLTPFTIVCSGKNCNPNRVHEWICRKCMEILNYGFDQKVYCSCGETPAISLEFKCCDPKHGVSFVIHEQGYLLTLLSSFRQVNILLLCESGESKTTWINGLVNILKYESLEDTEKADLINVQPETKNNMTPKIYPYKVGNTTIRIIDLPDLTTDTIDEKIDHYQNMLTSISNLEEIHGICTLLCPNHSQESSILNPCMKQAITYFGPVASQNVVFCVRDSQDSPERVFLELQQTTRTIEWTKIQVTEETVYFFDNEPFHVLSTVHHDPSIEFSKDLKQTIRTSWEKNTTQANRMIKRMRELQPAKISEICGYINTISNVRYVQRPTPKICRMRPSDMYYTKGHFKLLDLFK